MSGDGLSAEVHFAQRLAGNEKKTRDRAVKRLRKWLEIKASSSKGGLTEEDLLKIWKGLHYCMWMSDKPVIQEELASSISSLIQAFQGHQKTAFSFIKTFFQTEAREWSGIDRWRIDKFMMLIRCFLHEALVFLKNGGWVTDLVQQLIDIVFSDIIDVAGACIIPDGLKYHIIDIYMDELTKVGASQLSEDQVLRFLEPFYMSLPRTKSQTLLKYVISHLFNKLMEEEVIRQREGEPGEDSENTPFLQVNFGTLADKLFELAQAKSCISRNRPVIYHLVTRLRNLENGILPAEDVELSDDEDPIKHNDIASAMRKLEKLDEHLIDDSGMSEKKKKKKQMIKALVAEELKARKKKKRDIEDTTNTDEETQIIPKKPRTEELHTRKETPSISNKVSKKSLQNQKKVTALSKVSKPKPVFGEDTNEKSTVKKKKFKKQTVHIEDCNKPSTAEIKKVKSKKRKSQTVNGNFEQSKQNGETGSPSEFEEVDIWVPNKKYKGRLSGISPLSNITSTPTLKKKGQQKTNSTTPFGYFDSSVKTPPAFVRNFFTKLRTPNTEPVRKSKQMTTPPKDLGSSRKRVSFDMKKNTSQDFEESFSLSPGIYNPNVKPDQSILKSPPTVIRSKKKGTPQQGKRLKAADFF